MFPARILLSLSGAAMLLMAAHPVAEAKEPPFGREKAETRPLRNPKARAEGAGHHHHGHSHDHDEDHGHSHKKSKNHKH